MKDIEEQFDYLEKGTRIVIWNLRKIENSPEFELDFDHDESDVLLRDAVSSTGRQVVLLLILYERRSKALGTWTRKQTSTLSRSKCI